MIIEIKKFETDGHPLVKFSGKKRYKGKTSYAIFGIDMSITYGVVLKVTKSNGSESFHLIGTFKHEADAQNFIDDFTSIGNVKITDSILNILTNNN